MTFENERDDSKRLRVEKGLSISFMSSEQDQEVPKMIDKKFEVPLPELPEGGIDSSTYMANSTILCLKAGMYDCPFPLCFPA